MTNSAYRPEPPQLRPTTVADGRAPGVYYRIDGELVPVLHIWLDGIVRRRVVATLRVGAPIMLAYHPRGAAAVLCINLPRREIGAVVDVSESATQVVTSPDGTEIYVVNRDGISVICASDRTVFDNIAVGARPSCVATSSATGLLYVADRAGNVTALPAVTPVLQAAAG